MIRRHIYQWHRTLSLIIGIPVLLWAFSGFMHPIMTNVRPAVASQLYYSPAVDTSQLLVSLEDCLAMNKQDAFSNVHIVHMGGQQFYQVIVDNQQSAIRYFSTRTGRLLKNGDELYARSLAQRFLEGSPEQPQEASGMPAASAESDCCLMATVNILHPSSGSSRVSSVEKITSFEGEYKYINRYLPAYKVSFDRPDGIRLYVETASGRFASAVDNKRAWFDAFFGWFHTWEWMNALGNTKYFIMVALTFTAFLTTLMGLYIFFITSPRKSGHPLARSRRNHRYTSLVASLFTLLFTFSGGYHALQKTRTELPASFNQPLYSSENIDADVRKLALLAQDRRINNIGLVTLQDKIYWQIFLQRDTASTRQASGDLMKKPNAPLQEMIYAETNSLIILKDGEKKYAVYLAGRYSGRSSGDIESVSPVTAFKDEYGFVNKRLPVWKVSYTVNDNERYYIETSSGALAARVQDKDLAEGYSFALLHKHHFMDWGGKGLRDLSAMFWAAMQVAMVTVGFILYFRFRKHRSGKK